MADWVGRATGLIVLVSGSGLAVAGVANAAYYTTDAEKYYQRPLEAGQELPGSLASAMTRSSRNPIADVPKSLTI